MIGFSFRGRHSSTLNIGVRSVDRSLRPAKRDNSFNISGQHGSPFSGEELYENRPIKMILALINNENWSELRGNAREVAEWLSGEGKLIFDDEPDKYYYATIKEYVGIEQIHLLPVGGVEISFEAYPFAYWILTTKELDLTWDEADIPWNIDMAWDSSNFYNFQTTGAKTHVFDNPGTQAIDFRSPEEGLSTIKIEGSWSTITVTLNGEAITYNKAGTGTLIIDNINMEVLINGVNGLKDTIGSIDTFLTIKPGPNSISVSGTDLNVEVTIDFKPQWL